MLDVAWRVLGGQPSLGVPKFREELKAQFGATLTKTNKPPSYLNFTMATSLALQLQKIAAASTSTLDTKKLKTLHSASLLFDRAHAATQGLDTIFSIALNGFNELCALDHRFIAFEKGLFSESSKEADRFVQTKEEVKELDRSIEAFLELVSGRLLLKPAIKAVEWLVRRFRYDFHSVWYSAMLIECAESRTRTQLPLCFASSPTTRTPSFSP